MSFAPAAVAAPTATDPQLDTVARLGAQRRKFKDAARRLTEERDAVKTEVDALKAKIAELEKSGGAAKIAELETKLREQAHRGKFNEIAKAAGVKDKALGDIWDKSGYKAEGDTPDEAKIKAAIEAQRTERDYMFNPPVDAQAQQQQVEAPLVVPGPGRGQGGTAANNAGVYGVSQQQLRDPAWCFANQGAIARAAKEAVNLPTNQVATKFAILG